MRPLHAAVALGLVACGSGRTSRSTEDLDFSTPSYGANSHGVVAPSCSGRMCGSDTSGASCGTCSARQACTSDGLCEAAVPEGVSCPADGDVGPVAGKIVEPGVISLVQGGRYAIENNCAKAVYVLGVTETCSTCMDQLGRWTRPGAFLDQLKAAGVDVILVSTDNPQGASGSVASADALRKRFDLSDRFIIGYEPFGPDSFEGFVARRTRYSGARIALVVKPGNVIGAVGQIDDESQIRTSLGL